MRLNEKVKKGGGGNDGENQKVEENAEKPKKGPPEFGLIW